MNAKTDRPPLQCEAVARAGLASGSARIEGRELVWSCPNHDDRHPSLTVNPRENVWMCGPCGASGNAWELAAFLAGVNPSEKPAVTAWLREHRLLLREGKPSHGGEKGERFVILREHVYVNEDGVPLAKKIRWGSHDPQEDKKLKHFSWQRWECGKWVNGLDVQKQSALPLYRIDKIKDLPESVPVVICEGEHDADAGAEIDLATTTTGGTGAFPPRHAEGFRGKDVVIVPHADEPGRMEAQKRAALLYANGARVRVVEMPPMTPALKDLAEAIDRGMTRDLLTTLFDDVAAWKPAEGIDTFGAVFKYLRRLVSLTEAQARVVVLWAAHCHAFDAADRTPYLAITSAEKQSGKTRLLEILRLFVPNPWLTVRVTAAVLIRKIDAEHPALLLDESDAAFSGEMDYAEALRGVLNSGYARNGVASCCIGQGATVTFQDFSIYSAKAIAGIGKLPDTVADRSIPIRLKRARRGQAERFREREAERETAPIMAQLATWCQKDLERLREARPEIPAELTDRQADVCEPLLAIADLAGGDWPEGARRALVELCAKAQVKDDSIGVRLLNDIRRLFYPRSDDGEFLPQSERIASSDLAAELGKMEERPWAEWGKSQKAITPAQVARILHRYEIAPKTLRLPDGRNLKGYERDQFIEAWESYLPAESPNGADLKRHVVTTRENIGESGLFEPSQPTLRDASENAVLPNKHALCDGVTGE